MSKKSVLVIGAGGREHALCWKLAQSPDVHQIFAAPGSVGTASVDKVSNISLDITNHNGVTQWCLANNIDLVVVGPEDPLAAGIADCLNAEGILCFGPSKEAARIESDKSWAKKFMERHGIPTARAGSFQVAQEAKKFIRSAPFPALVVKAAGLATGKGVIVAEDREKASSAVDEILTQRKFGAAGDTIVVEELLEGEEVSLLAFTDGVTVLPMLPAQDHKRLLDGDNGPNTGGMGAYAPCPFLPSKLYNETVTNVLQKAVDGLRKDNLKYVGVLYAGLMITKSGPKVLEFNARFGDPETQALLPLLDCDLFDIMMACCQGLLHEKALCWRKNVYSVGVVMASGGYPETSTKGCVITGLENVRSLCQLVFHSGIARDDHGRLVTNGGRVLIAVAVGSQLAEAAAKATNACKSIHFQHAHYRRDIAFKGIARSLLVSGQLSYKASGVDIVAGDSLVNRIKPLSQRTTRPGCLGGLGGFGGLFDIGAAGYHDPVLVSGTDGVGTKLKIAQAVGKHSAIGIDLVAMCVNDVLTNGAEPLYFLDYFACGRLNVNVGEDIIKGVAEGCLQAGCALIGGETAEMPGVYAEGDYDLAGFAVGAVERKLILPRSDFVIPGDVIIGLPSSGVHSNGFSLVRKVMEKTGVSYSSHAPFASNPNTTFGEELLTPTRIYVKSVLPALRGGRVKAVAHITGGGLTENIPRVLPAAVKVTLDAKAWQILPVFHWLAAFGGISSSEMLRTFNCGIGMVLVVGADDVQSVLQSMAGEKPSIIGRVETCSFDRERVVVQNFEECMENAMKKYIPDLVTATRADKKRVAVLISGSGTNLQALLDSTSDPSTNCSSEIVLVMSNKVGAEGLRRAQKNGIQTKVISHVDFKSRVDFDMAMHNELTKARVDIVCLAGFMRVLSAEFVALWRGKMINIHPALLPSFRGTHAQRQALEAGVRVTGCTVHFVEAEVDAGAIIEQLAVPIHLNDTEESLIERIKQAEHIAYPRGLELIASGAVYLSDNGQIIWS